MARARRLTRWLSPAGFFLAGLFLLMPFAAVSCDTPGGYGRGAAGSTTTYTGIELATGDPPSVRPPERLRPPEQQRDDSLGAQPLGIAAALLIVVGVLTSIAVATPLRRRLTAAMVGAVAAVFLIAGQATVRSLLESRLREELTAPLPAGKQVGDYIQDQPGFWLCLSALLAVTVANCIGWLRLRR